MHVRKRSCALLKTMLQKQASIDWYKYTLLYWGHYYYYLEVVLCLITIGDYRSNCSSNINTKHNQS